jgi:transcriptional regulator with XRE-family HTH domain
MVEAVLPTGPQQTPSEAMGARLKAFRLGRRLTLRALAQAAHTSPGFLSQLERGQVNASVGTLRMLAEILGISLPDLFSDESVTPHKILRREDRPEIHAEHLTSKYLLSQTPLLNMEVYTAEFRPGGDAGAPYTHGDAQEMVVVVAGAVTLVLADTEYQLNPGDSAEYRTSIPHTVRNDSDLPAEVLWIISPPTMGAQ